MAPEQACLLGEEEAKLATAKLTDRLSVPVTAHETFTPEVVPVASGDLVLDMGQEFAGTFKLRERVRAGETTMPKVYLACGTEDGFLASMRAFRDQLLADGVDVTYDVQPGGHEWDFWDAQIKKIIDWLPLEEAAQGFGSGAID